MMCKTQIGRRWGVGDLAAAIFIFRVHNTDTGVPLVYTSLDDFA